MTFLEHLEELRWHLVRSSCHICRCNLAFIFKNIIFDKIILAPKSPDFPTNVILCELGKRLGILKLCINTLPLEIISIKMAGQFSMHIMVSLIVGLVIAFPYVFYEFWKFWFRHYTIRRKGMPGVLSFTVHFFSCSGFPSVIFLSHRSRYTSLAVTVSVPRLRTRSTSFPMYPQSPQSSLPAA